MPSAAARAARRLGQWTVIRPQRRWLWNNLRDVWEYRELLVFLLWRDVRGNYRQMALGPLWMVIRPIMSMLVFTVVFGGLMKTPNDGVPYPLFFYSGLLPWSFFNTALHSVAASLTANMHLISKVYFPRLVIPLAAALAALVDFVISFVVLAALMVWYRYPPTPAVLLLPLYVLLATVTALGAGLWVAALSVKYRDVAFGMNYATQALMYLSPVVYASSAVPERFRTLYQTNPMAQVIDGFRWSLMGAGQPHFETLAVSAGLAVVLLVGGIAHFQRAERTVVDLL